jgi:hypothetical protein
MTDGSILDWAGPRKGTRSMVVTTVFWCTCADASEAWLAIGDYPRAAIDAGPFDDANPVSIVMLNRRNRPMTGNVEPTLVDGALLAEIGGRWFERRPDGLDGHVPGYGPKNWDLVAAVIPIERVDRGLVQAPPREVLFVQGGCPYYRGLPLKWPVHKSNSCCRYFQGHVEHPDFSPVSDGDWPDVVEQILDQVDAWWDARKADEK